MSCNELHWAGPKPGECEGGPRIPAGSSNKQTGQTKARGEELAGRAQSGRQHEPAGDDDDEQQSRERPNSIVGLLERKQRAGTGLLAGRPPISTVHTN